MRYKMFSLVIAAMLASTSLRATSLVLSNEQITATWELDDQKFTPVTVQDNATFQRHPFLGELFSLVLTNGEFMHSASWKVVQEPRIESLAGQTNASRLSERLPGQQIVVTLASPDGNIEVTWRGVLRDGSRYLRQLATFKAKNEPVPVKEIMLLEFPLANARVTGTVDGSPVVADTIFFGVEHPLSVNRGEIGYVRCFLPRGTPIQAGESFDCSSVVGFVRKGQMRRDFLAYLERERAHPYRPFLNYNSWYDIGYFSMYTEHDVLGVIRAFGEELVKKRGVKMDSLLLDDGWDDYNSLWRMNKSFPNGLTTVRQVAAKYGMAPGVWLSPWGGYGPPKEMRLSYGLTNGFEIRDGSFSMAGPKYYERFSSLCLDVVKKYGVNQFKFDGIGGSDPSTIRDFEAMLRLIAQLRAAKPDIYINQTTGTWPSPFWLLHADSIWRGGEDHEFTGGGNDRQRWMTYRDSDVYDRIVGKSELYPLNSLMLHGIIYAKSAHHLNVDNFNDFTAEVRSFFGSGTQMQEMYITPALMKPQNWDALAEAAKWARANADTLIDTHWAGGNPYSGEVYGWASWSPKKGILTLRNPSRKPKEIKIDAAKVFELPDDAARSYKLVSPYKDQKLTVKQLRAGKEVVFALKPFEVIVMEAIPEK